MDFNLKFKYEGVGKQASAIRQKAIKSGKDLGKSTDTLNKSGQNSLIGSMKSLSTSIQKLIASNKNLENVIKSSAGKQGGGISGGGGGGKGGFHMGGGGSAGFGSMGASIPILGAGIALLGFTIQKVNQIGNAYIQKTMEQSKSVGLGGFRRGQGMYLAGEMGAGMKAYSMSRGKFSSGTKVNKAALDVGAIYGLSAEKTLGEAGTFKRAGMSYGRAVNQGLGAGVQSELPTLLTGMASMMEEAIRNGVNTSDLSKDMGQEIGKLAIQTPGKSVEAALNIMRNFQGVKNQVSRGQLGTVEGMYTAQASRDIMMEKLTGAGSGGYVKRLVDEGAISKRQGESLLGMTKGATPEDVQKKIGGAGYYTLLKKTTSETDVPTLHKKMIQNIQKQWGTGAEGYQKFTAGMGSQLSLDDNQMRIMWNHAQGRGETATQQEGSKIRQKLTSTVEKSAPAMGIYQGQRKENMVLDFGAPFAKASVEMEMAMMKLAREAMPIAQKGISLLGNEAMDAAKKISNMNSQFSNLTGKKALSIADPRKNIENIKKFFTE